MRERLLDVSGDAALHRFDRGDRVGVVRRRNHDGVDLIAHLFVHFAEINETFRVGNLFAVFGEEGFVDVADRDPILLSAGTAMEIALHAAQTDVGKIQFRIDIKFASVSGRRKGEHARDSERGGRRDRALHKETT